MERLKEVLNPNFAPGFCTRELHMRSSALCDGSAAGGGGAERLPPLVLDESLFAPSAPAAASAPAVDGADAESDAPEAQQQEVKVPTLLHPLHGLNAEQHAAVESVVEGAPVLLTLGPPGTGKTTARGPSPSSRPPGPHTQAASQRDGAALETRPTVTHNTPARRPAGHRCDVLRALRGARPWAAHRRADAAERRSAQRPQGPAQEARIYDFSLFYMR